MRAERGASLALAAGLLMLGPGAGGTPQGSAEQVAAVCGRVDVLCVDDTPGPSAEASTIQAAVDVAGPGDTVLVFDGEYAGFRVRRSGRPDAPLRIAAAADGARVTAPQAWSDEGIYIENANWVIVEGFELDIPGSRGFGIAARDARAHAPMRGVVVRNNVVRGTGSTGIYLSHAADSIIEGNVVSAAGAHGIYLSNAGADDTTVRGNRCFDNRLNGIHFNGDDRLGGDGVQTGLVVERNVLHGNGANGLNMDGVQHSIVRNNLVYDNGRHALRVYAIDAAAGAEGLTIVNNTFVDNPGWAVKLTQDTGGHVIFNNILLSGLGSLCVAHPDFVSDHNVVADGFSVDGEETVVDLGAWRRSGNDVRSRQSSVAAAFVDAAQHDYRLASSSPAVDAGTAILRSRLAPGIDLTGASRPQGATHDVGALEGS